MTARAPRMPVATYRPGLLEQRWSDGPGGGHEDVPGNGPAGARGGFRHGFDRDLHLVVLWSGARHREREVLDLLAEHLVVWSTFEIAWSPERIVNDFERLYGWPLRGVFGKHREVGDGPLLLAIVEDREPAYAYRRNVSGLVELTNVRMASAKAAARELTGGGYRVHSSNNLGEFFRDATLLLGPDRLRDLLDEPEPSGHRGTITDDLVGVDGWKDLRQLFDVLATTAEYVVLRNFETLPDRLDPGDDLDLLCRDPQGLAAICNAVKVQPGTEDSGYLCDVAGRQVYLDIRGVDDGYYDRAWADAMLARRRWVDDLVAVPRADDHLFSLLYHAKVHKLEVKPAYVPRLAELAATLDLGDLAGRGTAMTSDEVAAPLLDGFLAAHGYGVPVPLDRGVQRNTAFLDRLVLTRPEPGLGRQVAEAAVASARRSRLAALLRRSPTIRRLYRRLRGAVRR